MERILLLLVVLFVFSSKSSYAQEVPVQSLKTKIKEYKKDVRGPYYRIKWYCADETIRDSKDPCPDSIGGGIQHASYKPELDSWKRDYHIALGNILNSYSPEEFWDEEENYSFLKQYQLGKYLASVDEGWIYRKGQFYRGAMQSEDEQDWGKRFYKEVLSAEKNLAKQYFLLRQSLRDIPHEGDSNLAQSIRSASKVLAESFPDFMDLRIKIHGNPEATDLQSVQDFKKQFSAEMKAEDQELIDQLIESMDSYYQEVSMDALVLKIIDLKGTNRRATPEHRKI